MFSLLHFAIDDMYEMKWLIRRNFVCGSSEGGGEELTGRWKGGKKGKENDQRI